LRFGGRIDENIDLAHRAHQRLLADDMLAGFQAGQRDIEMQVRRQADIDDVDVSSSSTAWLSL
jgi:hypothetical protein